MVICDKCKKEMRKTTVLNVSNTRYEVYACKCGAEKRVCLGVNL